MSSRPTRVPPHDLEAEESLLGAMLLSRDALAEGIDIVTASDFYKPAHGDVFDAIVLLHGRGEPADPVTVTDELRRLGKLERAGGLQAVMSLQAATPSVRNAATHGRIVKEMSLLRRMIAAGSAIAEIGWQIPGDVDGAVAQAEQLIYDLGRSGSSSTTRPLEAVIVSVLEQLVDRAEKGEQIDGVPTGWAALDAILAGLSPGDVTIVGARPAMGKSQFAVVMAWQVALTGRPVLFASLEMKAEEIGKRWLGTVAKVHLQHIRRVDLNHDEWDRLNRSIASFKDVPLYVLDNYGADVGAVAHAGRRIGMTGGLVIIDYAQLITPKSKAGTNRNNEVAEISRAVKIMAGELGCHVVLLSQLNRTLEGRGEKKPGLADLRDSGALEQDASNVLALYRDEVYNPGSRDTGILEVLCLKQRNGPLGTARLNYNPAWGRIRDLNDQEAAQVGVR